MERVSHEHAQVLENATGRIETVEDRIASGLIERREMLEGVLAALEQRASDLDRIGQGFALAVGDQLRVAETRARDIGAILAQSSADTTNALTSHYDAVRMTSISEREQTTAALSAAYETATAEMTSLFTAANDRFARLVGDMRTMSAAIRDELDMTRAELSRGLVELPRETQETTETMRRVVSDQIKALGEITDIVARSGRIVEVPATKAPVATAPAPTPRPEARVEAPRPAPQPAAPAPARPVVAPRPTTPVVQTPVTQAPVRPVAQRPVAPTPAPAPAPARQKVEERYASQPASAVRQDRGPGWLSDLLARASREEETTFAPAAPTKPVQSADFLTTLSDNVGALVMHDELVDAWDAYLRGEEVPFSRPLYSHRGVDAFEDVRRRYEREVQFRSMIDAYIAKFEELLREVAPRDRDAAISRSILASDEGKVYTLLAHASGRIS
jgi:hypothetical protein